MNLRWWICAECGARARRCGRCASERERGPLFCPICGCSRCGWGWDMKLGRFAPGRAKQEAGWFVQFPLEVGERGIRCVRG